VDYVSFDPRMPIELRMVIVRVVRDDIFINQINEEVLLFIEDMINMVAELDEMTDKRIPAEPIPKEVIESAKPAQEVIEKYSGASKGMQGEEVVLGAPKDEIPVGTMDSLF